MVVWGAYMRRAAKIDANQAAIVKALRQLGCTVQSLAAVGDGVPDLLVGAFGTTLLMEVKDPKQPPSKRKLKPLQEIWHREWTGGPVSIVMDIEGAVRAVNAVRNRELLAI